MSDKLLFADLSQSESDAIKGGMTTTPATPWLEEYGVIAPSSGSSTSGFKLSTNLVITNSFNSDDDQIINSAIGNGSVFSGGLTKIA